eukprot:2933161-Rhodomonas_salina.3
MLSRDISPDACTGESDVRWQIFAVPSHEAAQRISAYDHWQGQGHRRKGYFRKAGEQMLCGSSFREKKVQGQADERSTVYNVAMSCRSARLGLSERLPTDLPGTSLLCVHFDPTPRNSVRLRALQLPFCNGLGRHVTTQEVGHGAAEWLSSGCSESSACSLAWPGPH